MTRRADPPLVSALVPTWNGAEFVSGMLDSLAAQTYAPLEIIISDDGSDDATLELCRSFADERANARVIAQPRRLGWIGNSNALLAEAAGELHFFAFHDDRCAPTYVAELVDAMMRDRDAVLAYSDVAYFGVGAVEPVRYELPELARGASTTERASYVLGDHPHWWLPFRGLVRARASRRVGGLRAHLGGESGADRVWLLHLAMLGRSLRVPEPLYEKRRQRRSLARSWRWSLRQRLGLQLAYLREIVRADVSALDQAALLRHLATRRAPFTSAGPTRPLS